MSKRLFKTMAAVLAIAAAAAGPVRGQTTYNVTFGGFNNPYMNTTVNVASLPQTFTEIGGYNFYPWQVISAEGGCEFTSVSVTSDGNGKVSANMVDWSEMTITVSGTFEGTATIHVEGYNPEIGDVGRDITVSCVAAPVLHTVRFAEGMSGWQVQDVTASASATAPAVLQNVMAGDSLVVTAPATLPGKVKSVKAKVKKRPEFVPGATIQNLESFVEVENNRDGTITLHMPTLNPSTYNVTNSSYLSNGEHTLHYGYELGSGTDMSAIGTDFNTRSGWSDHTPFSELDKTIDITSGKPRVAILITGHVQSATCPAPGKEHYWGLYRYTNPVKVTYNLGGGSVSGSTADKVEYLFSGDALATTFAAPTREGFTFDGWYTSAEGGTKLTASNATSATTIYAHWNAIDE